MCFNKQLLDEVEHDIMSYQNRGLCYLAQPSASADNTDTRDCLIPAMAQSGRNTALVT